MPTEQPSLIVTTTADVVADDGVTSLREAIAFANDVTAGDMADGDADNDGNAIDTITFDATVFAAGATIVLNGTDLDVDSLITIQGDADGDGDRDVTIDGDAASRIFTMANAGIDPFFITSLQLNDLVLQNGRASFGGAIAGSLFDFISLNNVVLDNNVSTGSGGAIGSDGFLTVVDTTFSNNSAGVNGGAVLTSTEGFRAINSTFYGNVAANNGGAIYTIAATTTAVNSTFADNTATSGNGGAIFSESPLYLQQSTITNNYAGGATGGVFQNFATATIENTILLGNTAGTGAASTFNFDGTMTGSGNLMTGDPAFVFQTIDAVRGGGVVGDNGGPVQTVALNTGLSNPALDAATATLPTEQSIGFDLDRDGTVETTPIASDARGFDRSVDLPGVGTVTTDIGASEVQDLPSLIVTTTQDVVDANDGLTSLREAIAFANDATAGLMGDGDADNDGNPNDTITFAAGMGEAFENGGLIRLVQGELEITNEVTINGAGQVTITGDADDDDITVDGDITDVVASFGGTAGAADDLLDDNSRLFNVMLNPYGVVFDGLTLTGGRTTGDDEGGGAVVSAAKLTINDSTLRGNSTTGDNSAGGAILGTDRDIILINSLVNENSTTGMNATGGGISGQELILTDSTVSKNSTSGDEAHGGGAYSIFATSLTNSTVYGNATSGNLSSGGGIYTQGIASLTNSTISGNAAAHFGGGVLSFAALYAYNITVSGNAADGNGGGIVSLGLGFGNYLTDSIVAGNFAQGAGNETWAPVIAIPITYNGTNIVGTDLFNGSTDVGDVSAAQIFAATFDNNGVDAGVLADNGGPVQTIALNGVATNAALDASAGASIPATDARGQAAFNLPSIGAETGDGVRDLGAFELQELPSLVVTTEDDVVDDTDGLTSLREALAFANNTVAGDMGDGDADNDGTALDTITFASGAGQAFENGGLIRLTSGTALEITSAVKIDGTSAGGEVVITGDANGNDSLIAGTNLTDALAISTDFIGAYASGILVDNTQVLSLGTASDGSVIQQLTITGGVGLDGGGGSFSRTEASVIDSTFVGNLGGLGGGIYTEFSDLAVTGSTFRHNFAYLSGGGLFNNTDMAFIYETVISNSTFYGNESLFGAGLFHTEGLLTLSNSTVSGNTATYSGGGVGIAGDGSADITVQSSIIAGNTATAAGNDVALRALDETQNTFTSGGYNLIGDGEFQATSGTINLFTDGSNGDMVGTAAAPINPFLNALQDNGGPTETLLPSFASPVVDAGSNPLMLANDQRGTDFDRDSGDATDIGAVEVVSNALLVTTTLDIVDANDGLTSLREAIALANDATAGDMADGDADNDGNANDTITFAAGIGDAFQNGGTITLGGTQLSLTSDVTIDGGTDADGKPLITIDADGQSRVFSVENASTATLSGLVITGGSVAASAFGGGVNAGSGTNVTITNSWIYGNYAGLSGGGLAATLAEVTIEDSLISDNSARVRGGGLYARVDSTITVSNSTFDANQTISGNGGGLAVQSNTDLTLTNVTLYENTSGSGGGAILGDDSDVMLRNITATENTSASGPAIFSQGSGSLTIENSILTGNYGGDVGVGNLSGSTPTYTGINSLVGVDAGSVFADVTPSGGGVLADNGGPVPTVGLLAQSTNPALDVAIGSNVPAEDARGIATVDLRLDNGGTRDLGAFELAADDVALRLVAPDLIVTTTSDVVDATDGVTSLREAIELANLTGGGGTNPGTITFDQTVFSNGTAITLAGEQLLIASDITIQGDADGDGIGDVIIDADGQSRAIMVVDGTVDLNHLTITNGQAPNAASNGQSGEHGGGLFLMGGTTTLYASTVSGNSAGIGAGYNAGLSNITDPGIGGNGGGVYIGDSASFISLNSAISDNNAGAGGTGRIGNPQEGRYGRDGGAGATGGDGGGLFIASGGSASITNTSLVANLAGAGGEGGSGGAGFGFGSPTDGGDGGIGGRAGGVYVAGSGTLALYSSTLSGNQSGTAGAGGFPGGQVFPFGPTGVAGQDGTSGEYGGIYAATGSTTTIQNTIILGNRGNAVDELGGAGSGTPTTSIVSGDAALVFEQTETIDPGDGRATFVAGVSADNGGPVQTVALRPESSNPAIDASTGGSIPAADARGEAAFNVVGAGAEMGDGVRDIGAFEVDASLVSLIVTTLDDTVNANDGLLSLREAIALANDTTTTDADGDGTDQDTITFDASLLGGEIDLSSALMLTSDIVINGDISGDGAADISLDGVNRNRLFNVDDGSTTLQNLTLRRGNAEMYLDGGAIYVGGQASLTVLGSTISDSSAVDGTAYLGQPQGGRGGGIFAAAGSTVTIADSTFTGNRGGDGAGSIYYGGSGASGGNGGAIWSAGDLTITNSTFQNNRAGDGGFADFSGDSGGVGGTGGALFSSGTLTIDSSTISGNRAGTGGSGEGYDPFLPGGNGGNGGGGGGIRSTGTLTITNSAISANSAGNGGSGAYGYGGGNGATGGNGGGLLASGTVNLANTTFSDNSAGNGGGGGSGLGYFGGGVYGPAAYVGGDGGNGGSGGAIALSGGTANLSNVTAAGNTAGNAGSGAYGYLQNGSAGTSGIGGGAFGNNTTLSIAHGTLTGNSAGTVGGGLAVSSGAVEIINSIVLGNTGGEVSGTVAETSSITTGVVAEVFDEVDVVTGGGALADNGGPVQTVALAASLTNPAIDAGTGTLPADTLDLDDDMDVAENLPVDARGFTRDVDVPGVGGTPDIGAFEIQTIDTPGPDILTGTNSTDLLIADQGGADLILALDGNDGILIGPNFDPDAQVNGGDGDQDQIGLQGDFSAGITFGAQSTEGIEGVVVLSGSDTRFGATGTETFSYDISLVDANIPSGEQLSFVANSLQAGEDFTLDASAETDGSVFTFGGFGTDSITGGQQNDAFFFGEGTFGPNDKVDGQGGSFDAFGLQGDFSTELMFGEDQLMNIEFLALLSRQDQNFPTTSATPFNYVLTMADGNVASGETLIVSANALLSDETLTFDGSMETDGSYLVFSGAGSDSIIGSQNSDTISGLGGSDTLRGEGGDDTFLYSSSADSTAAESDNIFDFTIGDVIDLSGLDADTSQTGDQAFSFIGSADFSNTAGQLQAVNAAGNSWRIEADVDGDSIADFAIDLTTTDNDPITDADFLL